MHSYYNNIILQILTMHIKPFIKQILKGNTFCSVEISSRNEKPIYNLLILKKRKNQLVVIEEVSLEDISDIKQYIKNTFPIQLIINEHQVISKVIECNQNNEQAVLSAFPNLIINDFYYELLTSTNKTFVSICRKSFVDQLVLYFQQHNFNLININLANLNIGQLGPYYEGNELLSSNALITIQDKKVIDIQPKIIAEESAYFINGLHIKNTSINGLAGILGYFSGQSVTFKSFPVLIKKLQSDFEQKHIFKYGLTWGLGLLFIVLLMNFMVFSHYSTKTEILNSEILVYDDYRTVIAGLTKKVDKQKKLVDEILISKNSVVSINLDRIGEILPENILLNELIYQPLLKKMTPGKEIEVQIKTIIIRGNSKDRDSFSEWLTLLEKEKWVESITVLNFGIGKESESTFEIKLTLSE